MDASNRIRAELIQWDNDAQKEIVRELIVSILESGIMNFDANEMRSLVKK